MYRDALLKQKHLAKTNLLQQTNSKITNVTNLLCWEVYQEGFLYQNSCSYQDRPLDFDPDSLLNLQCCFFLFLVVSPQGEFRSFDRVVRIDLG